MRNLTKTIAAVSLLAPASAYPLGIGDIKLHSALNQNLDAEIALVVSAGENVSGLNVRLAPPEKFDQAGVPWSYFLSKIKFRSVVRADGAMIIKLSSKEALREPFLDFLLEVSWDKGNLYREFTVLVDPPVAYTQPVIPVVEKATQITVVEANFGEPVVVEYVDDQIKGKTEQNRLTQKNDSLWKISEEVNSYDDVSIEQMMMAIYQANPKAFYKDNVNALMAGHKLDIPEKEIILKLSQREAMAAFKQQSNVWKGVVAEKRLAKEKVSEKTKVNKQLELEAPVESVIPETVVVVSKSEESGNTAVESATEKSGIASSEESLALQSRMDKLEQQLVMMQKMLVLKDEQIAALQNQRKVVIAPELKNPLISPEEKAVEPEAKKALVDKAKAVVKAKPEVVKKPKPKPIVQKEPESDFLPDYFSWSITGVGLAILGLLGLFWWRKRNIEDDADSESMFATASEISLPGTPGEELSVPAMDDGSTYDVGTVGESSFLSEFTPSDFDAFDTDENEVDPISEADVYLAYGRFQQAEELMRQAIDDQPERDECKLKLLEIFYANENKSAFEEYATELVGLGKHNEPGFWEKVVEMGAELNPSSTLFTGNAGEKASFETDDTDESIASVIVDNSVEKTDDITEVDAQTEEQAIDSVDFDLSVFDEDESNGDTEEITDDDSLDFDLSVFDLEGPEVNQTEEVENKSEEIVESIDFDLSLPAESNAAEGKVDLSAEVEADESLDSFDFSLDSSPAEDVDTNLESSDQEVKETDNFNEFEFDFDLEAPSTDPESLGELDQGVSDLTDMDELETKIDLAKAYIDMEDTDAARAIAEEVLKAGSKEQKKSAQAIIDQLK